MESCRVKSDRYVDKLEVICYIQRSIQDRKQMLGRSI